MDQFFLVGPELNVSSGGFFVSARLQKLFESALLVQYSIHADVWVWDCRHGNWVWLESKRISAGTCEPGAWRAGAVEIDEKAIMEEMSHYLHTLIARRAEIIQALSLRLDYHRSMAAQLEGAIEYLTDLAAEEGES